MIQKNTQEEYSNLTSPRTSSLPTLISEGPSEAFRAKINDEASFIIHASDPNAAFTTQLQEVISRYNELRNQLMPGAEAVMKRYFLSDAANQEDEVYATDECDCALSVIQQPPLDGTKVALWVYVLKGIKNQNCSQGMSRVSHGAYEHLWIAGETISSSNSKYQTTRLLEDYVMRLIENECTLKDNCVRTWFFVNDIDNNYEGVVKARNEVFVTQDLTANTHYISSTGIGGRVADSKVSVCMDAYAIKGLLPNQMTFLYALDHMNRTSEYGVSFERATQIDYGDRRHVFVSGTASIDNKGQVVYPRDIKRQVKRMWENVDAILDEAEMHFDDITFALVYLRDPADYAVVSTMFHEQFPHTPYVLLHAPVCRPGWLIEMECMAVKANHDERFPNF